MEELTKNTITETPVEAPAEAAQEAAEEVLAAEEAPAKAAEEAQAAEAPAETAEETAAAEASSQEAPVEAAPAAEAPAESAPEAPVETMEDYAQELEASFRKINEGDLLTGTVISVTEDAITLDLGYYTDGIIRFDEAGDDPSLTLKDKAEVGQKLSATVIRRDDGEGHILMSMKEAATLLAWDRLRELKQSQANVTVHISETTRGGAVAKLEGVRGFIPASKLALEYVDEEALPGWVGKSVEVRVIDADEATKHLVLSARDILWEKQREERARRISNVEVGLVTEGTVETLKPFGAFVRFGEGLSGLVHISQISQKRIKTPGEVLKEGQSVKVKVIGNKDGKISLSMKALEEAVPQPVEEETFELPKTERLTTSLADLLSKIKL